VAKTLAYSDDPSFGSAWFWELDTFMKFKNLQEYIPSNLDYPLLSSPGTFRLWYDLIEEYTPREFKDISNRLVAISGLARQFGNTIRCHEYVGGLWKPDLIRGLIWHTEGSELVPRQSADTERAANNAFPSWSWASVGYEVVKNSLKDSTDFRASSRVEDVQIDLVDPHQPYGLVKSGRVTIKGPLKRVPRLYNREWECADAVMCKLERHLSEIVQGECSGAVEPRYSSPPGGHFAVLQMLGHTDAIDLLVLEATGKVSNDIATYRRVGVGTLHSFSEEDAASPSLIAQLNAIDTSLAARLGPRRWRGEKLEGCNDVVADLGGKPWKAETVTIV